MAISKIILVVVAAAAVLIMLAIGIVVLCIPSRKKNYNASQYSNVGYQHGPNPVHVGAVPQQPVSSVYDQQPAVSAYDQQQSAASVYGQQPACSQQPAVAVQNEPAPVPACEPPAEEKPQPVEKTDNGISPAANAGGFSSVVMQEAKAIPAVDSLRSETTALMPPDDVTVLLAPVMEERILHRVRTGEQVVVKKEEFLIGRSSHGVDYRIADNNSVSRVHAKIILRGESAYLMDMKAANGSSLNSEKMTPLQEYLLHDGDMFTLANEEFVYHT